MIWHPFTPQLGADEPVRIVRSEKEFLYDSEGKEYIDAISSWWTMIHGHRHPAIIAAINGQLNKLDHVLLGGFTHEPAERLAAELLALTHPQFAKVFYSDNGSTAVEVMLKLALQYWHNLGETQRTTFVKFDVNYHGDTLGAMSAGGESVFNRIFSALMFNTQSFPYPTQSPDADAILRQFDEYLSQYSAQVIGIILEPLIAAAGGMVFQSEDVLRKIDALAKKHKVLLLLDEVFTGMGRTGAMFAYQRADVEPDMIALAKGLTGGVLPLAATLVSEKIHAAFVSPDPAKTFYHGHTMTGNPPGAAAALASLELFRTENRLAQVVALEDKMRRKWVALAEKYPEKIGDVRVLGAASAADLKSRSEKPGYIFSAAKAIRRRALEEGVILRPLGSVLYLTPPYNISDQSLNKIFHAIDACLASFEVS